MPTANLDEVVAHLNGIRDTHGEEAFKQARLALAKQLLLANDNGAVFLKKAWPDLDLDEVRRLAKAEQEGKTTQAKAGQLPEQMMVQMMRDQIPNLKTQGQFDLFMTAFNALQQHLNAVFGGHQDVADQTRASLNKTLDLAPKLTEVGELIKEVPVDQQSEEAQAFTGTPKQFDQHAVFQSLMGELEQMESFEKLQQWYGAKREQMDRIVDQSLRDKLFDRVRHRRQDLSN